MNKELCPNCGSKYFHIAMLEGEFYCEECQELMILEDGQFYLSDITGNPLGNALKIKGFVFR